MASPVSVALAKAQCSIHPSDTTWDALLPTYIAAAVDWVEDFTGQALEQRTFTDVFATFTPYLELSKRPVASVETVSYIDENGDDQTVDGALTRTRLGIYPVRVYPVDTWPTAQDNEPISVAYTAGYADGEAPASLVQACLLLIGHWFMNREAVVIGDVPHEMQLAVESLCIRKRAVFV